MAYDFNGTTQYLRLTTSVLTAVPLTLAGWANIDTGTIDATDGEWEILTLNDFDYNVGGNAQEFKIEIGRDAGTASAIAAASNAGTAGFAISSTVPTVSTWHHVAGVFTSATSRTVYLNAAGAVTETTNVTPSGISDLGVGAGFKSSTIMLPFNGKLAELAAWNAALTAAEIAVLADGFSPQLVRPASLVFYAPLVRDLINKKSTILTNVGTTLPSVHPPMRWARNHQYLVSQAAAAGATFPGYIGGGYW